MENKATEAPAENIYEAILNIYKAVGYVQKSGTNTFHKYTYAGEADFIDALRPLLIEQQVIFFPSEVGDVSYAKHGDTVQHAATYHFTFRHVPSGTSVVVKTRGEGSDKNDKSAYKSNTGALKYALRQAFLIETGNDPDDSDSQPTKNANSKAAAKKPEPAKTGPSPFADDMERALFCTSIKGSFANALTPDDVKDIADLHKTKLDAMKVSADPKDAAASDDLYLAGKEKLKSFKRQHISAPSIAGAKYVAV